MQEHLKDAIDELIDIHVLSKSGTEQRFGRVILDLGRAEQMLNGSDMEHQSLLLKLLVASDSARIDRDKMLKLNSAMQTVKRSLACLQDGKGASEMSNGDIDVRLEEVKHELHLTGDLLLLAIKLAKALSVVLPQEGTSDSAKVNFGGLSPTVKTDLANKLLSLREQFRILWLTRYHPQGMQGSLKAINNLLTKFIPEEQATVVTR